MKHIPTAALTGGQNSIFYNLDDTGNVSVGFSYNRGLDENSGTMTNQYTVSLNGKI
jgi:hypothetical protein